MYFACAKPNFRSALSERTQRGAARIYPCGTASWHMFPHPSQKTLQPVTHLRAAVPDVRERHGERALRVWPRQPAFKDTVGQGDRGSLVQYLRAGIQGSQVTGCRYLRSMHAAGLILFILHCAEAYTQHKFLVFVPDHERLSLTRHADYCRCTSLLLLHYCCSIAVLCRGWGGGVSLPWAWARQQCERRPERPFSVAGRSTTAPKPPRKTAPTMQPPQPLALPPPPLPPLLPLPHHPSPAPRPRRSAEGGTR